MLPVGAASSSEWIPSDSEAKSCVPRHYPKLSSLDSISDILTSFECLPLELHERIIMLGPQEDPDRVIFLCKCALVCKYWLHTSRSSLALHTGGSRFCDLIDLVQSPLMTLANAIQTVRVTANMGATDQPGSDKSGLVTIFATLQQLPSISHLSFGLFSSRILLNMSPMSMPNVRVLVLRYMPFGIAKLHSILVCFPNLDQLEFSQLPLAADNPPSNLLNTTRIRVFDISIQDTWDIETLDQVVAASPSLQRLTLQVHHLEGTLRSSGWLITFLRRYPSVYLSVVVKNWTVSPILTRLVWRNEYHPESLSPLLESNPSMDIILDVVHSLTIHGPLDKHINMLARWVRSAPRLRIITIPNADYDSDIQHIDWQPLALSLEHSTHMKEVIFVNWKYYERVPEYIEYLKVLSQPHLSVFVQLRDSQESLVKIN